MKSLSNRNASSSSLLSTLETGFQAYNFAFEFPFTVTAEQERNYQKAPARLAQLGPMLQIWFILAPIL